MTIIAENDQGWFLCTRKCFDNLYKLCVDKNFKKCAFKIQEDLFDIKTPFLMKSNAIKNAQNLQEGKILKILKKKRKKHTLCCSSNSYVDSIIKEATSALLKIVNSLDYLDKTEISSQDWFENNTLAQECAKKLPPFSTEHGTLSFKNQCDSSIITSYQGEDYLIPSSSTSYLCDVSEIDCLKEQQFDLILLDPPWENKSVKRKKKYGMLKLPCLTDLPIEKLCNPGCLIIVWVTNNKNQISFVQEELFPKWNVLSSVMWHWVKITKRGHFVHSIDSTHKKPYENLLLGRVVVPGEKRIIDLKELKPHKTIISIPSSIHSHKPPLDEILKAYLPANPKCLEIFARYLLPGWTSIGNEVLKLQNIKMYNKAFDASL